MKKRIASLFTSLLMIVSLMVVMPTMSVSASKSSATEIVSKADYLYNLTWSSQANFNGYINSKGTVTKYYSKGGVYRIPYGMPVNNGVFIGYGITPEAFINATKSSSNKFYTNRATYGSTNCNYYAMDCSTFVSYCWGLSTRHTTNSLPSVSKSLGKVSNSTVDSIQVGDAINKSDHVKLITDVVRDSNGKVIRIELTEETPPELKRTTISRDAFTSNNSSYTILRYADSLGATSSKPTNVILSKNQYWYDLKDTITLTPSSNGATSYVMSVEKDGKRIIDCISLNGAYSFAANKWGYGKYHAWISATNSAGTTDSSACDFEVVKAPSYSDVWCSKGFYDYDSNESIDIYIKASCTKGQTIGIDYLDENLNPVKRVVTSNCGNSYKISTKSLGKGYFSAYFTIWNGSGSVDTKRTYFYVGQKQNVGTDFYARIKNNAANKYLTNSNGNVNGTTLDCSKQQIWKFVRQSDNSYKLISAYDNGAMDVKDYATSGSGTNVQMNSSWDTNAQKFYIYYINKSYYFKPVCADLALDLSNKTSNLEVWGAGFNWNPQKFSIEKVNTNDIGVHKFSTWTTTKNATCTQVGTKSRKCTVCGKTETQTIAKTGHKSVTDKTISATCTTDGKTEGSHCSVCNTVIKVQTVINATGHKSSGWIVDKAASIGVKGSKHKECTVCKKVLETAEIPALPMINIQSANVSVSTNSYVFDNTAKKPSVTVKIGGKALKNGSDYTVSYLNNTKVGTATVRITGKGDYTGTITRNFTINPAKQQIQKLETRYKGLYIDWAQKGSATGYDVEYSVNANMNGAASRHLTANKPDTLTISGLTGDKTYYVRVRSYTNRNGKVYYGAWSDVKSIKTANNDITKVTVSGISTKAFTGKAITQNVTVKVGNTVLKNGTDYTVSYSNNKKVGNATVKITGKGKYGGVITKTFKINPAKQEIQKLTAKSKAFFIDWAQKGSATGYEIQYATNSKFTGAKKVTITNNKTDKTTVSKLSANKKYYVRVRSYTTVKGTKYYGAWSASKSVTTKK